MKEYFAIVRWMAGDIQALRPKWSKKKCKEFLSEIERSMQDRMIETGWEVIQYLLDDEKDDEKNKDEKDEETN